MEIVEHLVGYKRCELSKDDIRRRFLSTPIHRVAEVRRFLFSAAAEKRLTKVFCHPVRRNLGENLKEKLLEDIQVLTICIKREEPVPDSLQIAKDEDRHYSKKGQKISQSDVKSRFGFDWSDDTDNGSSEQEPQYVSYRITQQQGDCRPTRTKRKRHSRAKELKNWIEKMNKQFAKIEKHQLTVQYGKSL